MSSPFDVVSVSDFSHSNWGVVLFIVLIYISLMIYDMECLLMCSFAICVSFSEMVVKIFGPFLNQCLCSYC